MQNYSTNSSTFACPIFPTNFIPDISRQNDFQAGIYSQFTSTKNCTMEIYSALLSC